MAAIGPLCRDPVPRLDPGAGERAEDKRQSHLAMRMTRRSDWLEVSGYSYCSSYKDSFYICFLDAKTFL